MSPMRRRCFAFLMATAAAACSDAATGPEPSTGADLQLSVVGPQAVSEDEVGALAQAFDIVDEYSVRIEDAQTLESLVDTVIAVAQGGVQHELDIVVPEAALGRTVTITLIAYGAGAELYRSVTTTTLGDEPGSSSVELEIRYTGPGIRGRITDPSGEGVAGVSVNLVSGDIIQGAVQTEPDGTYLFLDVPTGSYAVEPALPGGVEFMCPGTRQVLVTDASDAIVANFGTSAEVCGTSVLVISGGDYDDTELVASLLAGAPDLSVTTFFFVNQHPSPDLLGRHDVVLLLMNGLFDESAALGTRIADYVALGGNVVTASFYWQGRSDSGFFSVGWGALESIDPFTSTGGASYQAADLGAVSAHPLTSGLVELSSTGYRGGVAAKAATTVVATWSDGTPLIGYRVLSGGQRMVAVSLFPGSGDSAAGDVQLLWENVLRWAGSAGGPTTP